MEPVEKLHHTIDALFGNGVSKFLPKKIEITGKSSYIVSLPKQWILDLGLKQGDPINVVRQGASTLQISPTQYNTRTLQIEDATFEVEPDDDNISIVRRLISLYFLGFKTI